MLKMSANVEELLNSRHSKCSFYLDQEMLFRTVSKKLDIVENSDDHRKTTEVFGAKWEIRQKNFVKQESAWHTSVEEPITNLFSCKFLHTLKNPIR